MKGVVACKGWDGGEVHPLTIDLFAAISHFNTPDSRLPTLAPPDFVTNYTSTGTALLTISGLSPSFENAAAALARPPAEPPRPATAPSAPPPPAAGAALSNESIPGTALATCEN